jgi:hypothetical protein
MAVMKRLLLAAAAALPLLLPAPALAGDGACLNLSGGFRLKICASGYLKACCEPFPCGNPCGPCGPGGGGGMAPWYLYWPMGAHFNVPAPTGYPYWPAAMTPPPTWGPGVHTGHGGFQPVGYHAVPSYWYGH